MTEQEKSYLDVWTTLLPSLIPEPATQPEDQWKLEWQGRRNKVTGERKGLWKIPNPPKIYYLNVR